MKVQDVYNLIEGLSDMIDKELPISTAYIVQRNHKKLVDEYKVANETRQGIMEKYKEKDTDDGVVIKKDKTKEFDKDIKELMDQEVDLALDKIWLEDLGETAVKPRTLALIDTIIKEDDKDGD